MPLYGCDKDNGGEEPIDPPGPTDPNPPGPSVLDPTDRSLTAPVTPVPTEAISAITFAIIRKGDLWLGIDDTRLWRQTNSGDVSQVVWAPNGNILAYFLDYSSQTNTRDLYTLVPGNSPILIDQGVTANFTWLNEQGFLWSPDSSRLAYGINGATEICVTGPNAGKGSFLIDTPLQSGPYWLSNSQMLFEAEQGIPKLVITDTMGSIVATQENWARPYPTVDGIFAANGQPAIDEGMYDFYYTNIGLINSDGTDPRGLLDTYVDSCLLSWPSGENNREIRYFAISDAESLFLQKYMGPNAAASRIDLLTHDVFLTYSEFSYPFWYACAPDGNSLAALPFTLQQEGLYGEQEGVWNLVLVDRAGNTEVLVADIYSVKDDEMPVPFLRLPLNWNPSGTFIYYLVENSGEIDLWRVSPTDKTPALYIPDSELPAYRP